MNYAYPVALRNKSKDNIITEITCIDGISNREDPTKPFKVCLKQHKSFVCAVLHLEFMSIDQIEKRSCALFAGGSCKFGATYSHSCCCNSIDKRLVLYKKINSKSLKREDSNICSKC